ncbi:MAG: phosphatidylglycerol--membrane-oligosaccharide glycerophosphotransferase [Kluyvera sp.]
MSIYIVCLMISFGLLSGSMYLCFKYKSSILSFVIIMLIIWITVCFNGAWLIIRYYTGEGINMALLSTLSGDMTGADFDSYLSGILGGGGLVLFSLLGMCWSVKKKKRVNKQMARIAWLPSFLSALSLIIALSISPFFYQVAMLAIPSYLNKGPGGSEYYHVPQAELAKNNKNIVYIYAESLEATWFDKVKFPRLTAELDVFRHQATDFSNTLGYSTINYTIGGIVASQCGLPMMGYKINSTGTKFFPDAICLGDILQQRGYDNYFYQGADLRFTNKRDFFTTHGFKEVYGLTELIEDMDENDRTYRHAWGLYDDTLLKKVWERYESLSQQKKNFALFALTVDTHAPKGFVSQSCQRKRYDYAGEQNPSLSAIYCSQEELAKFIEKIIHSPWFANTIIVVSSDHPAMENTATDYLDENKRRNLFFIISADQSDARNIDSVRNVMDNGATLLDMLGGDNAIGLGRSSFSRQSLSAKFDDLESKFISWQYDIENMWGGLKLPDKITLDMVREKLILTESNTSSFPFIIAGKGSSYEMFKPDSVQVSLRNQLALNDEDDYFIWNDRCGEINNVLHLDDNMGKQQWCKAEGRLSNGITASKLTEKSLKIDLNSSKINSPFWFSDHDLYLDRKTLLRRSDENIYYQADRIFFNLSGLPDNISEISAKYVPAIREAWGVRVNNELSISFKNPLPSDVTIEITGKAFGESVGKPGKVKLGDETQWIRFGGDVTTQRVRFINVDKSSMLVITPPLTEGVIEDENLDVRRIRMQDKGIGLVTLKVLPQ